MWGAANPKFNDLVLLVSEQARFRCDSDSEFPMGLATIHARESAAHRQCGERLCLFGSSIDNVSMDDAVHRVAEFIEQGGSHRYLAMNVHKVVALRRFPALARMASQSDLVTADGQPIIWASRWLGKPLKGRVTGIDLMEALVRLAAEKGYRVFFLGATPEVLSSVVLHYQQLFPRMAIVGDRNGYWNADQEPAVIQEICKAQPQILFVAMSSPRKEEFIDRLLQQCEIPFAMGVGGAFDVIAGVTKRAPDLMRRVGLEWLWRVLQEPRRMWKRYVSDGIRFSVIVLQELLARRPS
jgi:N-acetylglucosaminyldiphosphoundecaprenol N-acetyl-beta-D-mannosaminyltransferase